VTTSPQAARSATMLWRYCFAPGGGVLGTARRYCSFGAAVRFTGFFFFAAETSEAQLVCLPTSGEAPARVTNGGTSRTAARPIAMMMPREASFAVLARHVLRFRISHHLAASSWRNSESKEH
jgi:hypothetical protein